MIFISFYEKYILFSFSKPPSMQQCPVEFLEWILVNELLRVGKQHFINFNDSFKSTNYYRSLININFFKSISVWFLYLQWLLRNPTNVKYLMIFCSDYPQIDAIKNILKMKFYIVKLAFVCGSQLRNISTVQVLIYNPIL